MYSCHYFMFPFRFDYLDKSYSDRHEFYKQVQFDKRINLEKLYEILKNNNWEYEKFTISDYKLYNEFRYFHDFVKDALYNFSDKPKRSDTSSFFEKKIKDKFYIIQTKNKYFKLDLKSINLRILDTDTSYKTFEVENNKFKMICDKGFDIESTTLPRQAFPITYSPNGYVDIVRTSQIEKRILHGDCVEAFITETSYEIDELDDLHYLQYLTNKRSDFVKALFNNVDLKRI